MTFAEFCHVYVQPKSSFESSAHGKKDKTKVIYCGVGTIGRLEAKKTL